MVHLMKSRLVTTQDIPWDASTSDLINRPSLRNWGLGELDHVNFTIALFRQSRPHPLLMALKWQFTASLGTCNFLLPTFSIVTGLEMKLLGKSTILLYPNLC